MERKVERVLRLYHCFLEGQVINKKEKAEYFRVNEKTIQRDIEDIRNFLVGSTDGDERIVYIRSRKGYMLMSKKM